MIFETNGLSVNILLADDQISTKKTPIIFLHGFTGSVSDWEKITENVDPNYFPISIDLPGHGETDVSNNLEDYSIESISNIITTFVRKYQFPKIVLCGYSMGGRVALSYAVNNMSSIQALILESTTAGIRNLKEREKRYRSDLNLAKLIENNGVKKFVEYWMELPLFDTLKSIDNQLYIKIIQNKLNNDPMGLANSLRGFSTGKMIDLWDKLTEIDFPILLVSGQEDKKFSKIASEMKSILHHAEHQTLQGAGHNVHLEKPKEFIKLMNNFLIKLK